MPDTRFTLIGKACVWIVRASDAELRTLLSKSGWKGIKRTKRKKRKGRLKKGSKEAKAYMARIRRMR